MNFRLTYALLGIVGSALLGLTLFLFLSDDQAPKAGDLFPSFIGKGFKPVDISSIEIDLDGSTKQKLVFARKSPKLWEMTSPVQANVNSFEIESLLNDLMDGKHDEKNVDVKDRDTHGLIKPTVKVTLKKGMDFSSTLAIGNYAAGDLFYATSTDTKDDAIWAVKKTTLRSLFKPEAPKEKTDPAGMVRNLTNFRSQRLFNEVTDVMSQTSSIAIEQGKQKLALNRIQDSYWNFDAPAGFGEAEAGDSPGFQAAPEGQINSVKRLLEVASGLQIAAPEDFIDSGIDLAKFGLDESNSEAIRLTINRRAQTEEEKPSIEKVVIGKPVEGQPTKLYARIGDQKSVAYLPKATLDPIVKILKDPKILRDKTLVNLDAERVDAIDIENASGKFELRKISNQWKIFDAAGKAQEANQAAIQELIRSVNTPKQVVDFPKPESTDVDLGFDKKAAELSFWLDGIEPTKKDEKVDPSAKPKLKGTPNAKLVFGKEAGETVYVQRILASSKLTVQPPKRLLELAKRSRFDFLDPKIEKFRPDLITRMKIEREGFVAEYEQTEAGVPGKSPMEPGKPPVWKINLPEASKSRRPDLNRIMEFFFRVGGVTPLKIVTDAPTAAQLADWKLDQKAPRLKVTLMDKDKKERVFLFGKETPEKVNVYARFNDGYVLEVPFSLTDGLSSGELLDMAIFDLDLSKVTGLKLTGWQPVAGAVVVREFLKDKEKWTFKTGGYELDQQKLEDFLFNVIRPKAESFLGKPPTPEQMLDTSKGALTIELTVDGVKDPVTLTLGADIEKDGKKQTYVISNQQPNQLMLVLQDLFRVVREKPAVFKKE
jgi:hypothetical protein